MSPVLQTAVDLVGDDHRDDDRCLARWALLGADVSIIDPFWGAGFVIVSWIACWLNAPIQAAELAACGFDDGVGSEAFASTCFCGTGGTGKIGVMRR